MLDDLRAAGADLVAISPGLPDHSQETIQKLGLGFDILRDKGNVVADAFGIRIELPGELRTVYTGFGIDLPQANGEGSWTLPMPARYVIDGGGTIRDARVHADYTMRPEPMETLTVVRGLS